MKQLLIIYFTAISFCASAQTLQWVKREGGTFVNPQSYDTDKVTCVRSDDNGNVYVCGEVSPGMSNIAGHPVTSNGESDIFLAKFDCNSNLIWVRTAGGKLQETASGIALDQTGHIYITGQLRADSSNKWNFFDTLIGDSSIISWYCAKFDTSGNYLWGRMSDDHMGQASGVTGGVQIDMNGNPVVCHITNGASILPGIYLSKGAYMITLDTAGNLLKTISINANSSFLVFKRWVMDDDGNFYGIGQHRGDSIIINGITYYHPRYGLFPYPNNMFYLYKCDSAGNFIYFSKFSDTLSIQTTSTGGALLLDDNGNVYVAGTAFEGMMNGNYLFMQPPGWNPEIQFLAKFDQNGQPLWTKVFPCRYGGKGYDSDMIYRPDGTIALAHTFVGPTLIGTDTIVNPAGSICDIVLTTLDTAGSILNYEMLTGNNRKFILTLSGDQAGNIYMGGSFENRIDVNGVPVFSTGGNTDGFIARFGGACITSLDDQENSVILNLYPNPASEYIYVSWPENYSPVSYKILNRMGQILASGQIDPSAHQQQIMVNEMNPGLYMIRLEDDQSRSVVATILRE